MEKKIESFSERLAGIRQKMPTSFSQLNDIGRIPPQAIAIEEAVLGAIMLEKDALTEVIDFLHPDVFYREEHKEIFKAIISLYNTNKPIDILTVTSELRTKGKLEDVGGAFYISELTNRVGSSANIEYHSRLLVEKYLLRELIKLSSTVQTQAYEETTDVFELLDITERDLFNISQGNLKGSYMPMSTLITRTIEEIERISQSREATGISGVPSGFTDLDKITLGWQKSDLIIIASRPGMGKTSFVLSMARNASVNFGKAVAVFSLEMSSIQLVNRLISAEAEIKSEKLRSGELEEHEWQQLHTKIKELSNAKIFIDDTPGINVFELRAKCRRMKTQYNIDMVIIDYLQLMNSHIDNRKNTNREQEISAISRALKSMAKDLDIPVIALSQLSRDVEKRGGNKKPMLSDLRESGSIEQDADQVLFIFRPEYYKIFEDDDHMSTRGIAEINIAKNRHGQTKDGIKLRFVDIFAKFTDYEEGFNYNLEGMSLPSKLNNHYENDYDDEGDGDVIPF